MRISLESFSPVFFPEENRDRYATLLERRNIVAITDEARRVSGREYAAELTLTIANSSSADNR
jgi:hypothetical protein